MEYLKKYEEKFSMTFKDICYDVQIQDRQTKKFSEKRILNNLHGQAKSGDLTAIMGPSGSGKTSLMNFINNRIEFSENSKKSGSIYINSEEIGFNKISDYSSYVMQDDVLFNVLTPYECLKISIQLKKLVNEDLIDHCTNQFLEDLQIVGCKDTIIGNPEVKGISGGERKRVSVGMELISNPSILFLDEPTSGLDSQTSRKIISLLKKIAIEKNIIVFCTIHQPSSNIFNLFDQLVILERGNIIYNDNPINLEKYFESINKPLKLNANPADSFIRIIEEHTKTHSSKEDDYFIDSYKPFKDKAKLKIDEDLTTSKIGINIDKKNKYSAKFYESFLILCYRCWLNFIRNPKMIALRIAFTAVFTIVISSVFWRLDPDTYIGVYARIGLAYAITINIFMIQVNTNVLSFPAERAIYIREQSSRLYSPESYYLSKNVIETPLTIFFVIIYATVIYFCTGFRTDGAQYFFIYLAGILLNSMTAQSIGYTVGTLYSTVTEAMSIVQICIIPFTILTGKIINESSLPRYIFWLKYLSPLKYSFEILITNELDDNKDITYKGGSQKFLDDLHFDVGIENCFIILSCMAIFFRVLALVFLKNMIKKTG